ALIETIAGQLHGVAVETLAERFGISAQSIRSLTNNTNVASLHPAGLAIHTRNRVSILGTYDQNERMGDIEIPNPISDNQILPAIEITDEIPVPKETQETHKRAEALAKSLQGTGQTPRAILNSLAFQYTGRDLGLMRDTFTGFDAIIQNYNRGFLKEHNLRICVILDRVFIGPITGTLHILRDTETSHFVIPPSYNTPHTAASPTPDAHLEPQEATTPPSAESHPTETLLTKIINSSKPGARAARLAHAILDNPTGVNIQEYEGFHGKDSLRLDTVYLNDQKLANSPFKAVRTKDNTVILINRETGEPIVNQTPAQDPGDPDDDEIPAPEPPPPKELEAPEAPPPPAPPAPAPKPPTPEPAENPLPENAVNSLEDY
ncbi:MAG: hypothetical protein U1D64_03920, partial [Bacteroidales bacterium]|nr:hypothetical protein [Bacteroidales bacterium]